MTVPKKSVRWGILSTAKIATKVCRAIKLASNAEPVAIASRTIERAENWASEHDVKQAYGSYEELLEDESIDAIYLPTPPTLHAEWTIRAAECGKHVLCEKPLAANVDESLAMAKACERKRRTIDGRCHVGTPRTHAQNEANHRRWNDGETTSSDLRVFIQLGYNPLRQYSR